MKYFTKDWYTIAQNMDGFMRHDGNEYQWHEEKEAALQPAREQYAKHINKLKEKLPDSFDFVRMNMHDSWIVAETYDEKDLVFDVQSQWGFSKVDRLIFVNAKITENDGPVRDTCWVSDELYLTDDNQYEIHILTQGDTGFVSRVILADDVLVEASDNTIIP